MGVIHINPYVFGGAAPSFTPADLFGSGENGGWWDASDMATLWTDDHSTNATTGGDLIYWWDDKSGNVNHLTQATSGSRPSWSTTGLVFDGTSDVINSSTSVGLATDYISAFMVIRLTNWSTARSFLSVAPNSSGDEFGSANSACIFRIGTDNTNIHAERNSASLGSCALAGTQTTGLMIVESVFDGTYNTMTLNGSTSSQVSSTGTFASDYVRIGDWIIYGGGTYTPGGVAELILLDRVLSAPELTALRSYLNAKWSVY